MIALFTNDEDIYTFNLLLVWKRWKARDENISYLNYISIRRRSLVQMERFSNNLKFLFIKNGEHNNIFGKINLPIFFEEIQIKELLKRELATIGLSKIEIERFPSDLGKIKITIYGYRNCSNEKIKRVTSELKKIIGKDVLIAIQKIRTNMTQVQSLSNHSSIKMDENIVYEEKKKIIYPKILKKKERKRI